MLLVLAAAGCARASSGADAGPSSAPTLPVTAGDFPAYGHAPDFAWVAGRLVRSVPAGQCTYVIFSTRPGEPWGGRIALASSPDQVDRFPSGDMVVIRGMLDARALSTCGEPALSVKTIEEH